MTAADPLGAHVRSAASAYDSVAEDYDARYADKASGAEDRRVAGELRRRLAEYADREHLSVVGAKPAVLDVGCGTGWVLDHLGDGIGRYTGLDASVGMLARLRAKHQGADARQHDMNRRWPVGTGAFDYVISTFASPSYSNAAHLGSEAMRVLRSGGRIYLMPHGEGNRARQRYLPVEAYAGDVPWDAEAAAAVLERAGFRDVKVRGLRHPVAGPDDRWPAWVHDTWLRYEAARWRSRPDDLCFLIIEAVKP